MLFQGDKLEFCVASIIAITPPPSLAVALPKFYKQDTG